MRKKILGLVAVLATLASTLVLLASDPADAQRVANPGTITLNLDSGQLALKQHAPNPDDRVNFDAGSAEEPVVATLNLAANGAFTVTSLVFPPIPPQPGPLGDVTITISLIPGSGNGNLNPITGAMTLNFGIRIDLDGAGLGSNCRVSPINIVSTTGTTAPPAPNTPITGVPYNPATGRMTLVDNSFGVPNSTDCGLGAGAINDMVASPAGNNSASFGGILDPVVLAAIRPAFTATPSSGFAPLDVAFDGSSTFSSRPATYAWDFTNDASVDATGVTANHTYATPGTYTARLRVTDDQGDFAETTRTIQVNQPFPNVSIDKTGSASIIHGDPGAFTLQLTSTGDIPAVGATVVDTLPTGLTYTGTTSAGWSCAPAAQVVTCTSADVVAPGNQFEPLVLDVIADGNATGLVTNSATGTTAGEANPGEPSNSDTASTLLVQPGIDLDIDKTHDEEDGLFVGRRATYVLHVDNDGTVTAQERIRIVDVLPDGLVFVSASGGLDWVCSYDAPSREVRCFSDRNLGPGESLADVRIRVDVTGAVTSPLVNSATVSVTGDANLANNSDDDTAEVLGFAVDYRILKSKLGDVVVGEPATYGIGVQNVGTANGAGTVTVSDSLAAGLTYVSGVGDGWSCGAVGQEVTCTHPGGVEAGDVLPGISLQVVADASLVPSVSNTATVAGPGDTNAANDSSTVTSAVRQPQPDLTITKSHVGNFVTQANGSWTITVRNVAPERADGPTSVVDTLPAGVSYVSAAGTGWSCDATNLPNVVCTYAGFIPGLASAPAITLTAFAPDGAPAIVTNHAGVGNPHDTNSANNIASDPTRIDRRTPAPTTLDADAIVLKLTLLPRVHITLLNAPYAVLRSNGVPVEGRSVVFRHQNGTHICTVVTNAQGVAACNGDLTTYLSTLTQGRYTADFAGDLDYAPAHDEAAIIHLNALRIL